MGWLLLAAIWTAAIIIVARALWPPATRHLRYPEEADDG